MSTWQNNAYTTYIQHTYQPYRHAENLDRFSTTHVLKNIGLYIEHLTHRPHSIFARSDASPTRAFSRSILYTRAHARTRAAINRVYARAHLQLIRADIHARAYRWSAHPHVHRKWWQSGRASLREAAVCCVRGEFCAPALNVTVLASR